MVVSHIKNTVFKRIVGCPACKTRARIPIKLGVTLSVTCPSCKQMFQVTFPSFSALFKASFLGKPLPGAPKQSLVARLLPPILLGYVLIFGLQLCSPASPPANQQEVLPPQATQQVIEI